MLGLYKAEWLSENLFDLFSEPQYFAELKTPRPCVLIGGRGTGKTTVLKGLSYTGQVALHGGNLDEFLLSDFIGIYSRVNTNRVTAFKGGGLTEREWTAYFSHYQNLTFCMQLLDFVEWFTAKTAKTIFIPAAAARLISKSLGFAVCEDLKSLRDLLEVHLVEFEASINSLAINSSTVLSMQGAPLDRLASELLKSEHLKGKKFHFLIDEFENFEDYQQRVMNTLIKHASESHTFKIGVRELGWRERATLNSNELMTSPADYARIDISEAMSGAKFRNFASDVVLSRLDLEHGSEEPRLVLRALLPKMTDVEEANHLMESSQVKRLRDKIHVEMGSRFIKRVEENCTWGEVLFVEYWSSTFSSKDFANSLRSYIQRDPEWTQRVNNYFHSFLFSIRKGKSGLRKLYCGWDLYVRIADGNIRYLLELVHTAFRMHVESDEKGAAISQLIQTRAAQAVGKKNLDELQGLSVDGAQLTKLLLSLGRVFQIMAEDPSGHLAEASEFYVRPVGNPKVDQLAARLVSSAVMHLALVRNTANKLTNSKDVREYEYMVHPIFSPFFVFSSRRKRKIGVNSAQIIDLVDNPRSAIAALLQANNRVPDRGVELPDQMRLFGAFYD